MLLSLCLTVGCLSTIDNKDAHAADKTTDGVRKTKKGKDNEKKEKAPASPEVNVEQTWDLPEQLREVSGIAFLDANRFACIQDEEGTIYIYNTAKRSIEREIPFSGPGDYEGITLAGTTAYVVRSDGMIFQVNDIHSTGSKVSSYKTPLTEENNIEGLCYDKTKDRLLLAVKNTDPANGDYKGIYEFNLRSKSMNSSPVYKIFLQDEMLVKTTAKKKGKSIMPSAIVRHPAEGDLYILDGPASGLLIMDKAGRLKHHYVLGGDFAKPEGITFSPAGEMYVSNEGKKQAANIMKVKLTK
jgi:uncharacterized protein YjiK